MTSIWRELRGNPLLWLLPFVPIVLVAGHGVQQGGTALFFLSILAILPLAALLSRATEAAAARLGDTVGGLLNATLGNLTELVIAITALSAGEYMLVKASIAGTIVTNILFILGGSLLLGGLRHRTQRFNVAATRLQAGQLFLVMIVLSIPSAVSLGDAETGAFVQDLSLVLAFILIGTYILGLVFSLGTHREFFSTPHHEEAGEEQAWSLPISIIVLGCVALLVALVSEIFVGSVQTAAEEIGLSDAFIGFIVVALVGGAAETATAFSAARKNRLDLSIGIALGSATQIALFVAPVLVLASYFLGPSPMDLRFWTGALAMMMFATLTAAFITNGGRSAWFVGVLVLAVYATFASALYLLPPQAT